MSNKPLPDDAYVRVVIHESQSPGRLRAELIGALRARAVPNKVHYDSPAQAARWLDLHRAWSPSHTDPESAALYDRAFAAAAAHAGSGPVHVMGLGAGDGGKDARLLRVLAGRGATVDYSPVDSSVALVLEARRTVLDVVPAKHCHPLVCDLAAAPDLPAYFERLSPPGQTRLVTFFGMLPGFEPEAILPRVVALLRPGDGLLLSANLAPGPDYAAGVRRILPQYDNRLTRDWLRTFLDELGIGREDGDLRLGIERCPSTRRLLRVEAGFHFRRPVAVRMQGADVAFEAGDRLRVFFSYRYVPALVREVLAPWNLEQSGSWIGSSGEEGVFLCVRVRQSGLAGSDLARGVAQGTEPRSPDGTVYPSGIDRAH
ncbi:MAG: L-histidine N(alpha)-methyltransferase [Verrucomicrobia bacterium]|nr:L-histidine N(alpha)-methyltransferase [Verrucomicrobiota bacterium]